MPPHSDHYSIDLAKVLLSKAEHSVLIQLIRKQASSWEQRPYPLFLEVHRSHNWLHTLRSKAENHTVGYPYRSEHPLPKHDLRCWVQTLHWSSRWYFADGTVALKEWIVVVENFVDKKLSLSRDQWRLVLAGPFGSCFSSYLFVEDWLLWRSK